MLLEIATAIGGFVGALVAVTILAHNDQILLLTFIPVVLAASVLMFHRRDLPVDPDPAHDALADRLQLHGEFYNERRQQWIGYRVTGTRLGLALAGVAGIASGLLGFGGGIFYVPAMNAFMNLPLRVATATSTFMIGVTATAGAIIYLLAGDVSLVVAAPVCLGVLVGTRVGLRYQWRTSAARLKLVFAAVLVVAAALMATRAFGWLA